MADKRENAPPGLPSIRFVSDRGVLVEWSGPPSVELSLRVIGLLRRLAGNREIQNLHPAYTSLLIDLGKTKSTPSAFVDCLYRQIEMLPGADDGASALIEIPVRYDGADLDSLARKIGLTADEIARTHSAPEYRVGFLGFAPGFPYLLGLPDILHCARLSTPRLKVPMGSVAIAGRQTGIYPVEMPGGWQLIGRTDVNLFDPRRQPAALVQPGDRVRFKIVSEPRPRAAGLSANRPAWSADPAIEVLSPGALTSVQDRGRYGSAHLGVSKGGGADAFALELGNQIVGNGEDGAALEMTLAGGEFKFHKDSDFALTGSACAADLDGRPVEMWTSIHAAAGQILKIGPFEKMRGYLCLRGGFAAESLLGSRSTYLNGRWGGYEGRPLRAGDRLSAGNQQRDLVHFRGRSLLLRKMYEDPVRILRVTRGPQWDWFSESARDAFWKKEFEISNDVNRLGLRLNGPALDYADERRGIEMTSEGVADGAVQVPASGAPLILFCEQATTGGYPKIANVIDVDMYKLAQLKPGDKFIFKESTLEEAWRLKRELEDSLQSMGFVR